MKRADFQYIVGVVSNEHDFLYEMLMSEDNHVDIDFDIDRERKCREFLLEARKRGFDINGCYEFDIKIENLNKAR